MKLLRGVGVGVLDAYKVKREGVCVRSHGEMICNRIGRAEVRSRVWVLVGGF